MRISLVLVFIASLITQCSSPKVGPTRGFVQGNDLTSTSQDLQHGWTELPKTPEAKTFVKDEKSVARGKVLYQHHCLQCHGDFGKGDGELATTLKIQPANLQNVSPSIPHSYLSLRINEGKGSMPQWKEMLTPTQTWDLTQYILEFSKDK